MFCTSLWLPLVLIGMVGVHYVCVQTGMAADPSTMENITSLMNESVAFPGGILAASLLAIVSVSLLFANFIAAFFRRRSSLQTPSEKCPVVVRGSQWIKKNEFEILVEPSRFNDNQSVSDLLPPISEEESGGMFGQTEATGLKDQDEDLTTSGRHSENENSPQPNGRQGNKAHQKAQPEQTEEVNPGHI